ncbi:MAG: flagellar hook-basal body complex protein FliE [Candidatus Thiodiazotropha taylori]|nr:flagellar hook-basal body complex protein FliE [Candidatus Thiodiazotropha taylori]MCG7962809.1 flagellar hook-basal body complex protein FliE [Candidatus Thiodiazotropha endolucinida]MCG8016417.1 flagellar hook-basal body complex protein FliE [Candidatus Thiodiazotropha sp. 'RUGA']MCG7906076.1 flagellar hook-basal body complex protein FliE [Candidatus Thiodiazotropha taylori]MCG7909308.1 flagellar hook-basal body complex protein FliE [Candidatus Thiodiazotropha taylori]
MNNSMNIDQVLAQMRVMSAQAADNAQESPKASGADFSDLLKQSIDRVNSIQQEASALRTSFESGEGEMDLAQVMIAAQKSSLSFEAMVQVRNKLVEAYKDVMSMPI